MKCQHCPSMRLKFFRAMTNVDKYFCPDCNKFTFVSKENSPRVETVASKKHSRIVDSFGCDGQLLTGKKGYMAFNHQGKANKFLESLNCGEYVLLDCSRRYRGVKFVLTDTDIMGRRFKLDHMRKSGVGRFFVYPHSARPDLVNDIYSEWPHTTAHFVVSKGHAEIMESFGYSRPLVPVGWSLCPIKKFSPRKEPKKVLFAPIHPRCSQIDQDVNLTAFKRLEKLAKAGHIKLTVRFINDLFKSGLERVEHPNIEYTPGWMNQMYDQIDSADVVIAHQTFLYLAVARGVPAIGMANDMPTHIQLRNKPVLWARNWDSYSHLLQYPHDILQTPDVLSLLEKVVKCDEEIADWRKRMIGSQFRKKDFLEKLERFL